MRRSSWTGWLCLTLLAAGGAVVGASCENTAGQCELTAECTGAPGVVPGACDPNVTNDPVPEICGVFASATASVAEAIGSRDKPFPTLAQAIDAASTNGTLVVYACAETFAEALVLPSGVTVYGGLDCKNGWVLDPAARTTVEPAAGVPLTFEPGETIHVENVLALAPPGAPADPAAADPLSGGTSIAGVAEPGSKVDLLRCELVAGDGAGGLEPPPPSPAELPAADDGQAGDDGCIAVGGGDGGPGGQGTCDGQNTAGGTGGLAGADPGNPGVIGNPGLPAGDGGSGGDGQPDSAGACTEGGQGADGADGAHGQGASLSATLVDPVTHKGSRGQDGKAGAPGAGGGGGGGGMACSMVGSSRGAGGGGGGAGGCGGAPGKGGGAGGSSVALWAVDAAISLDECALTAKKGGDGATGSAGQKGGPGGKGGAAGAQVAGEPTVACKGGDGGRGGEGGRGGGGQGGSSIALVWKSSPPITKSSTLTPGAPGAGGSGATGGAQSKGADGLGCPGYDTAQGECQSL